MTWTRRAVLVSAPAAALALAGGGSPAASAVPPKRAPYGAATALADLQADAGLRAAIAANCALITPVDELKWGALRPAPGVFAFERADALADFAAANRLGLRGHTLLWHAGLPDWTRSIAGAAEAERVLATHIETVVSRYRGRIGSWDVVNEPIPDAVAGPADLRASVWTRWLGDAVFARAFRLAAAADPDARLAVNEYDVEFADPPSRMKREALRRFVRTLLDAGAPLHAVGLQGHLRGAKPIDRDGLARFVEELRGWGLEVLVTELDVMDHELPAAESERDAIVAEQAATFLSAAGAGGPLGAIVTWGLSDRYSWIKWAYPRRDGLSNRPLPLDADFRRKPMMDVIDRAAGRTA